AGPARGRLRLPARPSQPHALWRPPGRSALGRGRRLGRRAARRLRGRPRPPRAERARAGDGAPGPDRGDRGTMRDLQAVMAALAPRLAEARLVRGREIHGAVGRGEMQELAQILRTEHGVELRLMVGVDRRADLGAFEVYYLFAHPREDWFLHARKVLP